MSLLLVAIAAVALIAALPFVLARIERHVVDVPVPEREIVVRVGPYDWSARGEL